MGQLWTIIFLIIFLIAWGVAAWHDREEKKRQQQRELVNEKKDGKEG